MFLEILQNSHENTCDRISFLIKLQASGSDSWWMSHVPIRRFPWNLFLLPSRFHRQPSRGGLRKRCSEFIKQIYRWTFQHCSMHLTSTLSGFTNVIWTTINMYQITHTIYNRLSFIGNKKHFRSSRSQMLFKIDVLKKGSFALIRKTLNLQVPQLLESFVSKILPGFNSMVKLIFGW